MIDRGFGGVCAAGLAMFGLVASLAASPPAGAQKLLEGVVGEGHGVDLDPASRAAARALARASRAIDEGRFRAAERALATAGVSSLLGDYIAFERARLHQRRGENARAAELAGAIDGLPAGSSFAVSRDRLLGEARAATGDEAGARAAWRSALAAATDIEARRELKLAIVESSIRTGELEPVDDADRLLERVFAESALPSELAPYSRSPQVALDAAAGFVEEGQGEKAVMAYREALSGVLAPEVRRSAQMDLGQVLFRLRRYDEAIVEFAALRPEPEAAFWYARTLARLGRIESAIEAFEALAESAPPELASQALYLAGTLLEDRDQHARALAHFDKVAEHTEDDDRASEALWRIGWSQWHRREYAEARARFLTMAERESDPIKRLRPVYWAARAAGGDGKKEVEAKELRALARAHPLTYYGWRAQQRLGVAGVLAAEDRPDAGDGDLATTIPAADLARVALLLEAGLLAPAKDELAAMTGRVRTAGDRVALGRLLVASGDYHTAQRLVVDAYALPLSQGLRRGDAALWWLAWPPAYRAVVAAALGDGTVVEPALVWSVMREESGFRPEVMSSAGAIGLLQLMPETAEHVARSSGLEGVDEAALTTPDTNILLGSRYLEQLMRRFRGRESAAIGSYNAGPRAVERWLEGGAGEREDDVWVEDIPYGQTQAYVKRVLRSLYAYRAFY